MSTFLPFNKDPISTIVVAGNSSYTVPTGFYAEVTGHCKDGSSVDVNGTAILDSATDDFIPYRTLTKVTSVDETLDVGETYVVPADSIFEGSGFTGNAMPSNSTAISCYVDNELFFRYLRDGSGNRTLEDANGININGPVSMKLGSGAVIENRDTGGLGDVGYNEIHVVGYVLTEETENVTIPAPTSNATFMVAEGTQIDTTGGQARCIVNLYAKL